MGLSNRSCVYGYTYLYLLNNNSTSVFTPILPLLCWLLWAKMTGEFTLAVVQYVPCVLGSNAGSSRHGASPPHSIYTYLYTHLHTHIPIYPSPHTTDSWYITECSLVSPFAKISPNYSTYPPPPTWNTAWRVCPTRYLLLIGWYITFVGVNFPALSAKITSALPVNWSTTPATSLTLRTLPYSCALPWLPREVPPLTPQCSWNVSGVSA